VLLDLPKPRKQSISITPLIDVIFILLFFFMLSSTFTQQKQFEIKTAASSGQPQPLLISHKILLLDARQLQLDKQLYQYNSRELAALLQGFIERDESVKVAALENVKVQVLLRFIDQISALGNIKLSLSESVSQ